MAADYPTILSQSARFSLAEAQTAVAAARSLLTEAAVTMGREEIAKAVLSVGAE